MACAPIVPTVTAVHASRVVGTTRFLLETASRSPEREDVVWSVRIAPGSLLRPHVVKAPEFEDTETPRHPVWASRHLPSRSSKFTQRRIPWLLPHRVSPVPFISG